MRPFRTARARREITIIAFTAFAGGCSSSLTQDQSFSTGSLAPRPPAPVYGYGPPPSYAGYTETGSLGEQRPPYAQDTPRYQGNGTSYSPRPVEPARDYQPSSRWQAAAPPRQPRPAAPRIIQVQEGDTLYGLSRRHGITVADLVAANGLTNGKLEIGQRLIVPVVTR